MTTETFYKGFFEELSKQAGVGTMLGSVGNKVSSVAGGPIGGALIGTGASMAAGGLYNDALAKKQRRAALKQQAAAETIS